MSNVKTIAYYLTQFHQIPENDEWWGEGFTEWTNVRKAKPLYDGHDQPRVPYKYYDLSNEQTMIDQITMAKKYNLYGFCFYYYWFSGKRLLEKPLERLLVNKTKVADFPFMICWANENWTRGWDGKDKDILIAQKHNNHDHRMVVKDMIRHFKDYRYIRDDGHPVVMIYRPAIIDNFQFLVKTLREQVKQNGFPGVKILASEACNFKNDQRFDIDGIVQFPPHFTFVGLSDPIEQSNWPKVGVRDYKHAVDLNVRFYKNGDPDRDKIKTLYPCAFPAWDNTPRRPEQGFVWHGHSVDLFNKWIHAAKEFSLKYNIGSEKYVFVNAWNEWAEGAYLEPDHVTGYSRLEVIKNLNK